VIYDALVSGDIDAYVDYSGTLWANQFHHSDIPPRRQLLQALQETLAQRRVTLLGELGFENAYALVMPKKRAEALGIRSIADLAAMPGRCRSRATMNSFRAPNGPGSRTPMGLNSAASGRCSRTSCMPRSRPARST